MSILRFFRTAPPEPALFPEPEPEPALKQEPELKPEPRPKPRRVQIARSNSFSKGEGCKVSSRITVTGSGNHIQIGDGTTLQGRMVVSGEGNTISIGKGCHWKGFLTIKGHGISITIGDHSTARECDMVCMEGAGITIGKWCMFSRQIEIRTTDSHSLVDRVTGRRENPSAPVVIGDHVWIGLGAVVAKGSVIPTDCIVGAMAFVTGKFDQEGLLIAGVPAKLVRHGVTWNRARKEQFTPDELDWWRSADARPPDEDLS